MVTNPPLLSIEPITFSNEDARGMFFPHNDALLITIHINNCKVTRVLIDTTSSVNIIYGQTLDQMENTPEAARTRIYPQSKSLYGFDYSQAFSPG